MNDIEILERLIEDYEMCREIVCVRDIEAIKNLINRVKELEEELNKYIVKMTDEEYRRLVDIIRDEANKDWQSKIKEKRDKLIEVHKERDFTNKEAYYLDCYNELLNE